LVSNGNIYIEVQKVMHGLPHTGILTNDLLSKRLAPHEYRQTNTTPGLWSYDTLPVTFSLVVDDFGIKYEGLSNAHHIMNALKKHYTVSKDLTGGLYCGITLHWDYLLKHVDLSMTEYITWMLQKCQHPPAKRPQYSPHIWIEPIYGQHMKYVPLPDDSVSASAANITRAQGILGTLLTMLTLWISSSLCPSVPLRPASTLTPQLPWMPSVTSWTIAAPKIMPPFAISRQICN
jgi:hypothetical protein